MFLDEADLDISNEDPEFVDNSTVLELDQTEKISRSYQAIYYFLIQKYTMMNKYKEENTQSSFN